MSEKFITLSGNPQQMEDSGLLEDLTLTGEPALKGDGKVEIGINVDDGSYWKFAQRFVQAEQGYLYDADNVKGNGNETFFTQAQVDAFLTKFKDLQKVSDVGTLTILEDPGTPKEKQIPVFSAVMNGRHFSAEELADINLFRKAVEREFLAAGGQMLYFWDGDGDLATVGDVYSISPEEYTKHEARLKSVLDPYGVNPDIKPCSDIHDAAGFKSYDVLVTQEEAESLMSWLVVPADWKTGKDKGMCLVTPDGAHLETTKVGDQYNFKLLYPEELLETRITALESAIAEMPEGETVLLGGKIPFSKESAQDLLAALQGGFLENLGEGCSGTASGCAGTVGGLITPADLLQFAFIYWLFVRRAPKASAEAQFNPALGQMRALQEVNAEEARRKYYQELAKDPVRAAEFLKDYSTNLTDVAMKGGLDPVYGRDKEVEKIFAKFLQTGKTSAAITGEAGVGKTALFRALAIEIAKARRGEPSLCPPALKMMQIIQLNVNKLVAGTKYRGEFEDRLEVVKAAAARDPQLTKIAIDEGADNLNAGAAEGAPGIMTSLKGDIGEGKIGVILAMTDEDYQKTVGRDKQLKRRFPEERAGQIEDPFIDMSNVWTAEAQLKALQKTDPEFSKIRYVIDESTRAFIREKAPEYYDQADPDRSNDLLKQIITYAYMDFVSGDRSQIRTVQETGPDGQPLSVAVLTINVDYVQTFCDENMVHPEFNRVQRDIEIAIREIKNESLIPTEKLKIDPTALLRQKGEDWDVAKRRLERISHSLRQLIKVLNNPESTEKQVQDALEEVRIVFARKGEELSSPAGSELTETEKKKEIDKLIEQVDARLKTAKTVRSPAKFGLTDGTKTADIESLKIRSGEDWYDYRERLELVAAELQTQVDKLSGGSASRFGRPERASREDKAQAVEAIRQLLATGEVPAEVADATPPVTPPAAGSDGLDPVREALTAAKENIKTNEPRFKELVDGTITDIAEARVIHQEMQEALAAAERADAEAVRVGAGTGKIPDDIATARMALGVNSEALRTDLGVAASRVRRMESEAAAGTAAAAEEEIEIEIDDADPARPADPTAPTGDALRDAMVSYFTTFSIGDDRLGQVLGASEEFATAEDYLTYLRRAAANAQFPGDPEGEDKINTLLQELDPTMSYSKSAFYYSVLIFDTGGAPEEFLSKTNGRLSQAALVVECLAGERAPLSLRDALRAYYALQGSNSPVNLLPQYLIEVASLDSEYQVVEYLLEKAALRNNLNISGEELNEAMRTLRADVRAINPGMSPFEEAAYYIALISDQTAAPITEAKRKSLSPLELRARGLEGKQGFAPKGMEAKVAQAQQLYAITRYDDLHTVENIAPPSVSDADRVRVYLEKSSVENPLKEAVVGYFGNFHGADEALLKILGVDKSFESAEDYLAYLRTQALEARYADDPKGPKNLDKFLGITSSTPVSQKAVGYVLAARFSQQTGPKLRELAGKVSPLIAVLSDERNEPLSLREAIPAYYSLVFTDPTAPAARHVSAVATLESDAEVVDYLLTRAAKRDKPSLDGKALEEAKRSLKGQVEKLNSSMSPLEEAVYYIVLITNPTVEPISKEDLASIAPEERSVLGLEGKVGLDALARSGVARQAALLQYVTQYEASEAPMPAVAPFVQRSAPGERDGRSDQAGGRVVSLFGGGAPAEEADHADDVDRTDPVVDDSDAEVIRLRDAAGDQADSAAAAEANPYARFSSVPKADIEAVLKTDFGSHIFNALGIDPSNYKDTPELMKALEEAARANTSAGDVIDGFLGGTWEAKDLAVAFVSMVEIANDPITDERPAPEGAGASVVDEQPADAPDPSAELKFTLDVLGISTEGKSWEQLLDEIKEKVSGPYGGKGLIKRLETDYRKINPEATTEQVVAFFVPFLKREAITDPTGQKVVQNTLEALNKLQSADDKSASNKARIVANLSVLLPSAPAAAVDAEDDLPRDPTYDDAPEREAAPPAAPASPEPVEESRGAGFDPNDPSGFDLSVAGAMAAAMPSEELRQQLESLGISVEGKTWNQLLGAVGQKVFDQYGSKVAERLEKEYQTTTPDATTEHFVAFFASVLKGEVIGDPASQQAIQAVLGVLQKPRTDPDQETARQGLVAKLQKLVPAPAAPTVSQPLVAPRIALGAPTAVDPAEAATPLTPRTAAVPPTPTPRVAPPAVPAKPAGATPRVAGAPAVSAATPASPRVAASAAPAPAVAGGSDVDPVDTSSMTYDDFIRELGLKVDQAEKSPNLIIQAIRMRQDLYPDLYEELTRLSKLMEPDASGETDFTDAFPDSNKLIRDLVKARFSENAEDRSKELEYIVMDYWRDLDVEREYRDTVSDKVVEISDEAKRMREEARKRVEERRKTGK